MWKRRKPLGRAVEVPHAFMGMARDYDAGYRVQLRIGDGLMNISRLEQDHLESYDFETEHGYHISSDQV